MSFQTPCNHHIIRRNKILQYQRNHIPQNAPPPPHNFIIIIMTLTRSHLLTAAHCTANLGGFRFNHCHHHRHPYHQHCHDRHHHPYHQYCNHHCHHPHRDHDSNPSRLARAKLGQTDLTDKTGGLGLEVTIPVILECQIIEFRGSRLI